LKKSYVACAFAVALLAPTTAWAFEHQHHFGIDGGVAFISIDQKPTLSVGGGGGIHYSYGLSDAFNFLVEGAFCPVALQEDAMTNGKPNPDNRATMIENVGAGIAYTLDVVRWVPYVGVMASAFSLHGGTVQDVRFAGGATIAAGLDYQLTPGPKHFAIGIAVRQHFMLSDIQNYPSYTQIFLRAEYVWGF
jgi:hypothetical protein